ncbi:hypothetical protein ACFW1A_26840 [Kitasatospora sp. NPDC058965]|uniref:hypothetical protein n=1 Tax=Kitasatospora sp. NPDC058965 TaxID=3346682 RepID=UPI0036962851
MDIVENERRPHHYQFAHKVLAGLARDMGPRMLDGLPEDRIAAGLASLWDDFGRRLPEGERLPSDGLTGDLITLGRHRMLVVVMPEPIARAEAYYTAVVQSGGADHCRYFTLEYALNPFTGEPYSVLGEWTADGSHLNCGTGRLAGLSGFLTDLVGLLHAESAAAGPAAGSGRSTAQPKPERRGLRRLFGR